MGLAVSFLVGLGRRVLVSARRSRADLYQRQAHAVVPKLNIRLFFIRMTYQKGLKFFEIYAILIVPNNSIINKFEEASFYRGILPIFTFTFRIW